MVMDINNSGRNASVSNTVNTNPPTGKPNSGSPLPVANQGQTTVTPANTPEPGSGVYISSEAQTMQKLAQQLKDPPVNQSRVTQIKQAIANNTYTINPERIAEKLLSADEQMPTPH